MSTTRFNKDGDGKRWRPKPQTLLPSPSWERIRALAPEERRQVKQIARGRMRGDSVTTIASAVGLSVYEIRHLARILSIPTTSEFRRHRVLQLHRRRLSAPQVAERLGLTPGAVNIMRHELWLAPFPREKKPPRPRSKIGAEVAALVATGHSLKVKDIAKTLGVSRQTVYTQIRTQQIELRTDTHDAH